jgi:hypothetical protein
VLSHLLKCSVREARGWEVAHGSVREARGWEVAHGLVRSVRGLAAWLRTRAPLGLWIPNYILVMNSTDIYIYTHIDISSLMRWVGP